MTALILSPAYASHYGPLSTIASALAGRGERVVVATGPALRGRVCRDGFEWRELVLGRGSNTGVSRPADQDPEESRHLERFFAATALGPVATLEFQAERRRDDLLWQPEVAAKQLAAIVSELRPDTVLTDHIALSATVALRGIDLPFVTYVPGHPSQLPVGDEVYGAPPGWPRALAPSAEADGRLRALCRSITGAVTKDFNEALGRINPSAAQVEDPFREHGDLTLFGYPRTLHDPKREALLPPGCRFVGPCVRDEALPAELCDRIGGDRPLVYVSLGTFLSARGDILATVAEALRGLPVRAAIATGLTPPEQLGRVPDDWIVAPTLPQVAILGCASLAITHAGNNSVGEALRAGVSMITLPLSTDQFAIAADLERTGAGRCLDPNRLERSTLRESISALADATRAAVDRPVPAGAPSGAHVAADAILGLVGGEPTERPCGVAADRRPFAT